MESISIRSYSIAGLYSKEDKTQLVAYMRKLNKKVNEAVVQIGNQ